MNNKLYVFGGEDPHLFSEVEVYDPASDAWQQLQADAHAAARYLRVVIGNAIYIPGGAILQGFGATDVNEVYVIPPSEVKLRIPEHTRIK